MTNTGAKMKRTSSTIYCSICGDPMLDPHRTICEECRAARHKKNSRNVIEQLRGGAKPDEVKP